MTNDQADTSRTEERFMIRDSGERVEFASGMRRDVDEGKPRYDLINRDLLYRVAMHHTRGAVKYGERNWELASSEQEMKRFKASAFRHFMQWMNDERDEDHMAAIVFNLGAAEMVRKKLESKQVDPTWDKMVD